MKSFSIRALLVLTLLVAIVLAFPVKKARKQKRGRQWVADQRGHVYFEYGLDHATGDYAIPVIPQSVVRLLGVDLFNPVRTVVFDCEELVELEPITDMPSLETVVINIEMADSIDLSPLKELPELKELHLSEWSRASAEQVAELRVWMPQVKIMSDTHGDGG